MLLTYTCRTCGKTNEINSFWKWFWTPHFGAKKLIRCKHCGSKHYMERQNWSGPKWLDWPKDSK